MMMIMNNDVMIMKINKLQYANVKINEFELKCEKI